MKKNLYLKTAVIGVVFNIILSLGLSPLATKQEIKPPNGDASKLPLKSQVMHMLVHHKQVLLTSSVIVGLLTGLACWVACRI